MAFNIALSGLTAARSDLDTTGNNIANANTTGFKKSRAEFADVFSQAFGSTSDTAIGSGVKLAAVTQQFEQGNVENTGNALDLAINGEGFFVLSDDGAQTFTRDGAFRIDREGFVVNSSGQRLQAFPPSASGSGFNTGSLSDLQLTTGVGLPQATNEITTALNFAADDAVQGGAASDIDPSDDSTFNFTTSVTVFDSLGAEHTATVYARRLGNLSWGTRVFVDGNDMGTQDLSFDSNGQLTTGQPLTYPNTFTPTNGAAPISLDFDYSGTTMLGSSFSVNNLVQDGFTTGQLVGIDVSDTGVISARYTNGRSTALGQVALANFNNPQGLSQIGDNQWVESFDSGAAEIGEAGASNFGLLESGSLEVSNVDLTQELVKLITAQRNFDANSQAIRTENEITQTAINISR